MAPSLTVEEPPRAVDFSGRPITEGSTVAFISVDPIGLTQGRVRIIGPHDLCIETEHHLVVFSGVPRTWDTPNPLSGKTIAGGTITGALFLGDRELKPAEPLRYPQVALQADA